MFGKRTAVLTGRPEDYKLLGRLARRWKDNIQCYKESLENRIGRYGLDLPGSGLAGCKYVNEPSCFMHLRKFCNWLRKQ
jgi:hypothetical protein